MAFQLIPLPLSILFTIVFIGAFLVVIWKHRKQGRFYPALLILIAIATSVMIAITVYQFSSPTAPTPPSPKIEISTEKTSYAIGEPVEFQVYVNNPQNLSMPYPKYEWYSIGTTNEGIGLEDFHSPLPPNSITQIQTYNWTSKESGNYTLTVKVDGPVQYGQPASYTIVVKSVE